MTESEIRIVFTGDAEAVKRTFQEIAEEASRAGGVSMEAWQRMGEAAQQASQKAEQSATRMAEQGAAAAEKRAAREAAAAQKSAEEGIKSEQNRTSAVERANALIQEQAEKFHALKAQYSSQEAAQNKILTETLINDMKRQQDEKMTIVNAMAAATEKETKEELRMRKAEIDEELRMMKQVALEKEEVLTKGAGAKTGILGTGRQVTGEVGVAGGLANAGGSALSGAMGALGGLVAGGGAVMAIQQLVEKGKEGLEMQEQLKIGFMTTGLSSEEAAKAIRDQSKGVEELSNKYAVSQVEINAETSVYLKMGGSVDNLKAKQEVMIGLSERAGVSHEMAAKMLMKSTDPEIMSQLSKLGIKFSANATEAERFKIIQEKLSGTMDGMAERANGPLGQFEKFKNTMQDLAMKIGGPLMEILSPFLGILGDLASILAENVLPIISTLTPVIKILAEVVGWILKMALKPLTEEFKMISKVIAEVVNVGAEVVDTVKNVGESVLSFLGMSGDKTKEATDKNQKVVEDAAKKAEAERTKGYKDAEGNLDGHYNEETRKLNEQKNKGQISEEKHRTAMIAVDIAYWKTKVQNAAAFGQDDYDAQEKLHAAEVKLDEEKKKAGAAHAKAAKDAQDTARQAMLDRQANEKAMLEVKIDNENIEEHRAASMRLAQQAQFAQQQLDFDQAHHAKKLSADLAAVARANKAVRDQHVKDEQALEAMTNEVEQRRLQMLPASAEKEVALEDLHYKQEQAKYKGNAAMLELVEQEHQNKIMGIGEAALKARVTELTNEATAELKLKESIERQKIELMKDGDLKIAAQLTFELDAEKHRYDEEMKVFKGTLAMKDLLEQDHALKIQGIYKKTGDAERADLTKTLSFLGGPMMAGITQSNQHAGEVIQTMAGKYQSASALIAEASTEKGRASMGAAMAGLVEANAWMGPLAPLAIAAETVAIEALVSAGAAALAGSIKLADGGILTSPVFSPLMRGGAVAGEAGPEAIIPLHRLPQVMSDWGGGSQASRETVSAIREQTAEIRSLHQTTRTQAPVAILDQDLNNLSQASAQRSRDRRVIRGNG